MKNGIDGEHFPGEGRPEENWIDDLAHRRHQTLLGDEMPECEKRAVEVRGHIPKDKDSGGAKSKKKNRDEKMVDPPIRP